MRTIIYARVSTEDQAEKYGLPLQLRACRDFAKSQKWTITEEITDDGISGTVLARPGLDHVRELVAAGACDVVLMYDVDRLSRELAHLLILKPEIEKRAQLAFVLSKFEDSPSGRLFFGIRGVIGQYERELTRERTMRGQRERARSGLIVGSRVPLGYRYDAGRYVPDERAGVVRDIFRWYVAGESLRSIAKRLRADGTPSWSGRPWGFTSVRWILANETYCGVAHFGTHRREGGTLKMRPPSERLAIPVPALVDRSTWERAQARLSERLDVGRPSPWYLLRGLLYCSCGRKMYGNRSKRVYAYRCEGRDSLRNGPKCLCSINAAKLDAAAWEALMDAFTDTARMRQLFMEHEGRLRSGGPDVAQLKARVRKLRGTEDAALSAMLDPDMADSRTAIKAKYQAAQAERKRIEAEIAATQRVQVPSGEWIERAVSVWREVIPAITDPAKRQEFARDVMTRAVWDGTDLSMDCFFGQELSSTSPDTVQFPALQFVVRVRLAA